MPSSVDGAPQLRPMLVDFLAALLATTLRVQLARVVRRTKRLRSLQLWLLGAGSGSSILAIVAGFTKPEAWARSQLNSLNTSPGGCLGGSAVVRDGLAFLLIAVSLICFAGRWLAVRNVSM